MPNIEWFHTDWGTGAPLFRPSGYLIGDDDGAWIGFSAEPEIRRWTDSVTVVVRWSVAPWDARALADSVIDSALASSEAAQYPPEIVEQVRSIPLSPSPLSFDGLVLRHDGGIVIGPRWATCCGQGRRPAGAWMALDSEGIPEYLVSLPTGFGPAYFGPRYVLGVAVDELGRETIQRWELVGRP
jgi:hypothetical protein